MLIDFRKYNYTNSTEGVNSTLSSNAEQSLNVTNLERASGGASEETLDEVKLNASAFFNAQNRAVTRADYITRVYSLPQKYGNIAKSIYCSRRTIRTRGTIRSC